MNRDFECINLGEMFHVTMIRIITAFCPYEIILHFWVACVNTKQVKLFLSYFFINSYYSTAFNKYLRKKNLH